jgi:NAD(P) transhydrogenase subunit alpha
MEIATIDPFIFRLAIFVLAIFVGYYVVWSVTPALHTPLMSVTNAISSVIIVGALIAAGPEEMNLSKFLGFGAIVLAAVNIFGGFVVTQRMPEAVAPCRPISQRSRTWFPASVSSCRCAGFPLPPRRAGATSSASPAW